MAMAMIVVRVVVVGMMLAPFVILITLPVYLVGVVVGVRVFARLTDHRARWVSLGLMMALGALGLML